MGQQKHLLKSLAHCPSVYPLSRIFSLCRLLTHMLTHINVLHIVSLVIKCKMNVKRLTLDSKTAIASSLAALAFHSCLSQSDMTRTCHPLVLYYSSPLLLEKLPKTVVSFVGEVFMFNFSNIPQVVCTDLYNTLNWVLRKVFLYISLLISKFFLLHVLPDMIF